MVKAPLFPSRIVAAVGAARLTTVFWELAMRKTKEYETYPEEIWAGVREVGNLSLSATAARPLASYGGISTLIQPSKVNLHSSRIPKGFIRDLVLLLA